MHCPTCGREIAPPNEAAQEIAGQLTIETIRETVHPEVGDGVWRAEDFVRNRKDDFGFKPSEK